MGFLLTPGVLTIQSSFHSPTRSVEVSTSCHPFPVCRSFTRDFSPFLSTSLFQPSPLSANMHCKRTRDDDFQIGTLLSLVLQSVMKSTHVLSSQTAAGRASQRKSASMYCLVSHVVPMMEFDLALVGAVLILIIGIRTTWQRQFNLK